MHLARLEVRDVRNVEQAVVDLEPGLNVFVGRNAQGKTTLLEAVGLLARVRSFRTEDTRTLIRHGATALVSRGRACEVGRTCELEVELSSTQRRLRVDGQEVSPGSYHGRFEAVVYSTDRLRVVHGSMRERRAFVDRAAAALWPSYRQVLRDYERVLAQRNAALEAGGGDLFAWDERFVALGAELRYRRVCYVERLRTALREEAFAPSGERFDLGVTPALESEQSHRQRLCAELTALRREEQRARHTLSGPHRDAITLLVDGDDASEFSSSGQARSLLLALCLAALRVYREERGTTAVALLDDFDSELDEDRATALCHEMARRGQALVTTAHPAWASRLKALGRAFEVERGRVRAA